MKRLSFLFSVITLAASSGPIREIAMTIDDLPGVVAPGQGLPDLDAITRKLVAALLRESVPTVGFVNEGKLAPGGSLDPDRAALLGAWVKAGLELGNHTLSHLDFHRVSVENFEEDVVRGEPVTRALLEEKGGRLRYFRHPFLHTGRSLQARRALEGFLVRRGYKVAPVTVDDSDWIFARAYAVALQRGDVSAAQRVAAAYPAYIEAKIDYFERQSVALFSREIRQVLLLHANALNAELLPELARRMRKRGYTLISLDRALADPAYGTSDTFTGAGGISWLHRWALSRPGGKVLLGEPSTPRFVMDAAGVSEE